MTNLYDEYQSNEKIEIRKKDFYTDDNGFPNRNAFLDFCENIEETGKEYYLVMLNIDLRKANKVSRKHGDMVFRKFAMSLQSYYFFTMFGEKINIFVEKEDIPRLKLLLDKPNDNYQIFYSLSKEPYIYCRNDKIIRSGIDALYEDKKAKTKKAETQKPVAANAEEAKPVTEQNEETELVLETEEVKVSDDTEFNETALKKYISTMWYSLITVRVLKPTYEKFTLFVYPTKSMPEKHSLPLLVVLDDNKEYRVIYTPEENAVRLTHNGISYIINARFSSGALSVMVYKENKTNDAEVEFKIETHDGNTIPTNFGKRFSKNKQLFTLKRNSAGYWACVELHEDTNKAVVNYSGVVESDNGNKYGVQKDNEVIELIPITKPN